MEVYRLYSLAYTSDPVGQHTRGFTCLESEDPEVVRFETKLETDISCVTLANSITLTPGTITMDIRDGVFYVHALSQKVAADLNAGEMEDRVAHIFMEADHLYVQDVLDAARIYNSLRL